MGNPLGDRASERLRELLTLAKTPVRQTCWIKVHLTTGGQHARLDTFHPFEREVLIDTCLLRHLRFTVDQWYWRKRAESLRRSLREIYRAEFMRADFSPMGTPVEERVVFCLTNGIPPAEDGLGNEHHFQCLYRAGEESYEIRDQHLMLRMYLPVTLAEYANFNVSTWYQRRVVGRTMKTSWTILMTILFGNLKTMLLVTALSDRLLMMYKIWTHRASLASRCTKSS